jgi:hypothetical protein
MKKCPQLNAFLEEDFNIKKNSSSVQTGNKLHIKGEIKMISDFSFVFSHIGKKLSRMYRILRGKHYNS